MTKLSKWVENTVGKGEIIFKRLVSQRRQKVSLCRNGLKAFAEENLNAI